MCEHPSPSTAKSKLPGMTYTHLTRDERYQIAILAKAGDDQSEIADVMNRHRSTISQEFRRNRGQRGYRPKHAHKFSHARMRAYENGPRIADETWAFVDERLGELWSPAQISGRLEERGLPSVSHEGIYNRIYADKRKGAPSTVLCVVRKHEENATAAASGAAQFPTRCRSISVQRSSVHASALVTGRATWSLGPASSRHWSRSMRGVSEFLCVRRE